MLGRKWIHVFLSVCLLLLAVSASAKAQENPRHPVLLISIDGMHPSYVLDAAKHGLNLPVLSSFVTKGTYADRVVNVTPTVTYPNHTTIITGALPNEHGIYNNTVFDPLEQQEGAWNWYASQVKVPTLWHAAKMGGLVTGSVLWPVTVHSKDIDYNVPEFWRTRNEFDHYLMEAVSTPSGFLEDVEQTNGLFYPGEGGIELDEKATQIAICMIERVHPDLLTVHLVSLDHVEHETGPFSPEAKEELQKIDGLVGKIMAAELKVHPNADTVIVSDHGFFPVNHKVKLNVALVKAGLITVTGGAKPKVKAWKALVWNSGGSASVVLHDAADRATAERLQKILSQLAQEPTNGIDHILEGKKAAENGAMPQAVFLLDFKSGYATGTGLVGSLVEDTRRTMGTHGYLNTHAEINSAFFIQGPAIPEGRSLGTIDMRQIAPTLAQELGVALKSAKMQALPLR